MKRISKKSKVCRAAPNFGVGRSMLGNQHVRFGWGQSEKEQLMIPLGIQPSGSKNYRNLAGCLPNLSERRDAYRYAGKSVSYSDQQNELPEIKREIREEYQDIAAHVLQDVLRRLEKAFQAFFRRLANGEKPGYPRFKGRDRYDSFTYPDGAGWKFDGKSLHLSKIGSAQVKLHRPLEGQIKTITIKREVDQWYVAFSCEMTDVPPLPVSYEDVGIDLGVTHLATLSNGEMIEHPRFYRQAKQTLEKRQQAVSRKKKGSHRREKAKRLMGKAHRKIRNQRKDFLHKQSRKIVNRYQVIVFEDIKISNLVKRPKSVKDEETGQYLPNGAAAKGGLNKSILDAGWGAFVHMCSVNAAINILARGNTQLARTEPTRATA